MTTTRKLSAPREGQPITRDASGRLRVPDDPIIPFIEGDGTGPDIWSASVRVFEAAVARAYGVQAIPRSFLIGPDGRILQREVLPSMLLEEEETGR